MVNEDKFKACKHEDLITRKNGSFYCRSCGYDSARKQPSGKLANLMKQLYTCRENIKDLAKTFSETTQDLQERIKLLREIVKDKDKEIKELKEQIEGMLDEETEES